MLNVKSFRVHTGQCLSLIGQQAGANVVLSDLFRHELHQPSVASPVVSPRGGVVNSAAGNKPKQPPPPAKVYPNYKYFIAVGTHGIGGESGWGVIGDNVERAIGNAAILLDSALTRLNNEMTKSDAAGITSGKTKTVRDVPSERK